MRLSLNSIGVGVHVRGHGGHSAVELGPLEKPEDCELDGPKRGYCAALREGAHLLKPIGDP
jgi:hypothetical protein